MHFSNFANNEGQIKVEEWVKLAHENNIPAFIDAAADNSSRFASLGLRQTWDTTCLIAFSGRQKRMRGPQCAGLLIGKKRPSSPTRCSTIARMKTPSAAAQKVGQKKKFVGMVKAVEMFPERRPRSLKQGMAAARPRIYSSPNYKKIPNGDHVLSAHGNCQPRPPHAHQVGLKRNSHDPARSRKGSPRRQARPHRALHRPNTAKHFL